MKKILLFIALAAFSSASAQQKELFDINKYLQKKQQEKNDLLSQNKNIDLSRLYTDHPVLSYTLSNGDRVITFPSFHMPCIVPDMRQFQAMPNLANNTIVPNLYLLGEKRPGTIPNGAKPFYFKTDPDLKSLMQLLKTK